jgi:hypothetical protein
MVIEREAAGRCVRCGQPTTLSAGVCVACYDALVEQERASTRYAKLEQAAREIASIPRYDRGESGYCGGYDDALLRVQTPIRAALAALDGEPK